LDMRPETAESYPPRKFKLGLNAKYLTGAHGLRSYVLDTVYGKLYVKLPDELEELSNRISDLERAHGDYFFSYLDIACDYSDNLKSQGKPRISLADALFDDENITEVLETLWKQK